MRTLDKYRRDKSLIIIVFYGDVSDPYYNGYSIFYGLAMCPFYYWLNSIKAVKNYWAIHLNILEVYIDPKKIDYSQVMSLWFAFEAYKYKGRETLEKLTPYLPKNDQITFEENYVYGKTINHSNKLSFS